MFMPTLPLRIHAIGFLFVAATALMVPMAEAHVTRIVIDRTRSESPAFEGRAFGPDGTVGPYEKLRGRAFGEVDPEDPHNAVMTDLKRALRNARGKVEYSMDIFILKPIDVTKGSHKIEVASGKKIALEPGHIELIEDTTGKGHTTRVVGKEDRVSISIPLADQTVATPTR